MRCCFVFAIALFTLETEAASSQSKERKNRIKVHQEYARIMSSIDEISESILSCDNDASEATKTCPSLVAISTSCSEGLRRFEEIAVAATKLAVASKAIGFDDGEYLEMMLEWEIHRVHVRQRRAAAEAETQRSLAIRAVRVSGHGGAQSDKMGVYRQNRVRSPINGGVVLSLASGDWHLFRNVSGIWMVTDTARMLPDSCDGVIFSTTNSPSPFGLTWKYADAADTHIVGVDPALKVTEIST